MTDVSTATHIGVKFRDPSPAPEGALVIPTGGPVPYVLVTFLDGGVPDLDVTLPGPMTPDEARELLASLFESLAVTIRGVEDGVAMAGPVPGGRPDTDG